MLFTGWPIFIAARSMQIKIGADPAMIVDHPVQFIIYLQATVDNTPVDRHAEATGRPECPG